MISFDNSEYAFAYKSTKDLKKANFLFSVMGNSFLLNAGLKIIPVCVKWNIPFTNPILRSTIFHQFIGGETLEQTAAVADKLEAYQVQVILDYGVEGGGNGEQGFNHSTDEFIRVINYAASQHNIPYMSVKVTGISRFALLEKLDAAMSKVEGTLIKKYTTVLEQLKAAEKEEWNRVVARLKRICETAAEKKYFCTDRCRRNLDTRSGRCHHHADDE